MEASFDQMARSLPLDHSSSWQYATMFCAEHSDTRRYFARDRETNILLWR
jgi:hypothetical protein